MFKLDTDGRLSAWAAFRSKLEKDPDPLYSVWHFWNKAPFIPYNNKIDPYNQKSWPSPWEIIVDNRYDDFTRALMIAYTIKYTNRFANVPIELHSIVDKHNNLSYNIVSVDDEWVINYSDNGPISWRFLPDSFSVENLVVIGTPR